MRLERSVNFGDIEVDDIKAKMEDGLLNINIKLKEKENTKKDITIE
jgi:HSP20 family molecular chaperone IbpA